MNTKFGKIIDMEIDEIREFALSLPATEECFPF